MWKKIGISAVVAAFLAGSASLGYAQGVPGAGDQTQGPGSRPGSTGAQNAGSSAAGTSDMGTSKSTLGKESSPTGTPTVDRSMGNQTTGSGSTTGAGSGGATR
jgi:hypothetical protein